MNDKQAKSKFFQGVSPSTESQDRLRRIWNEEKGDPFSAA